MVERFQGSRFVKGEGCPLHFIFVKTLVQLNFLEGGNIFLAVQCFLSHLFCGHSDLSYVADFPKCMSANKQLFSKT